MAVMAFDVDRRGRSITQGELSAYSRLLASAVTEALYYFIGHNCPAPCDETRCLAVRGAHVIHMLRDMSEDAGVGYFNIPGEYLETKRITKDDIDHPACRSWVRDRVELARSYFRIGLESMVRVKSLRCRLAGCAYISRFEWMANAIEKDGFQLRDAYPGRKTLLAGVWIVWRTILYTSGLYRRMRRPVVLSQLRHDES
jgi:phytoene/squalene synthetase